MEKYSELDIVIVKWLTQSLDAGEEVMLRKWVEEDPDHKAYFDSFLSTWEKSKGVKLFREICARDDWQKVKQRMTFCKQNKKERRVMFNAFRRIAAVLILAFIVGASVVSYYNVPGLGYLASFDTNFQKDSLVLPDKSQVILNENSKLIFQKNLAGKRREVRLAGEGYFKVAKNPERPFVVQAGSAKVEVLGTEFDLETSECGNRVRIYVVEGRVRFSSDNQEVILVKGDTGILEGGNLVKGKIENEHFQSWRSGVLKFENAGLDEIVSALDDHFIEIHSVNNRSKRSAIKVTTSFNQQPLEEVIEELQIHFGKKISIVDGILIISD